MINHSSKALVGLALLAAASWCFLSQAGCNPAAPSPNANTNANTNGSDNDTEAVNVVEPAMPITTMDDMVSDLIDGTADSLTFQAGSAASAIQTGTLIASTSPAAPFLRRVVDTAVTDSGEVTLITEDVPLDEAFSLVDVEVAGTFLSFTPADGVTVNEMSQSSRIIVGVDGQAAMEVPVLDLNVSFKTNDNKAEASVGIKLKTSAILELKAGVFSGLQKIKVSMPSDYEMELGLSYKAAEASHDFHKSERTLGKTRVLFWIGPIPVYSEILLVGSVSANFTGALSVSTSGSAEIGGQWTAADGWSAILQQQTTGQQGKAKGQASAQVMATAKWMLYGALGPTLGLGPYIEASINAFEPCDVEIAGGLKAEAALQFGAKVLNEDLRDEKAFGFERKFEAKLGTVKLCESGPEAPTDLGASARDGKAPVGLTWKDNSDDESGFDIEWKTVGNWATMDSVGANVTSYSDKMPAIGETNYYRVFAVGPSEERSTASNVATIEVERQTTPEPPTDLGATVVDNDSVIVTWIHVAGDADQFLIARSTDGGGFTHLIDIDASTTSYVDLSVEAGHTYSYQVAARNGAGTSAYSDAVTVKLKLFDIESDKPAAPSHLRVSLSGVAVSLTWLDHSEGEDSFVIERSSDGGGFVAVGGASAEAEAGSDTVPDGSKIYVYRVYAVRGEVASDYSNVASTADAEEQSPNDEICAAFGWCCPNDNVCDSSWTDCPEEDPDCALCGVNDGRCPEMCVDGDPDCPSRELICGVMDTCCAGDGRCDTQCPLSEPDPDCTNAALCQATGFCCGGDGTCHTFCNETDSDCDPDDANQDNGNDNGTDNTNDNSSDGPTTGDCSSVSYFASGTGNHLVDTPIRVVGTGVDERLCADWTASLDGDETNDECSLFGLTNRTRPIEVCGDETVQVYDDNGNSVGSFTIPFYLIDGRGSDLPWVFIVYTPGVEPVLSVSIYFSETADEVDLASGDGGDAPCLPEDCPDPTGACCVAGVCTEETEADCDTASGTYFGDDIACADADCVPPDDYVVWYTSNVCCWGAPLVYISTRSGFEAEAPKSSYPGGGMDSSIMVTKVELQGGFATSQDAQDWLCPQVVSRFNHYWCGSGYVQMNGANWQIGSCSTGDLPVIDDAPDTDMCE